MSFLFFSLYSFNLIHVLFLFSFESIEHAGVYTLEPFSKSRDVLSAKRIIRIAQRVSESFDKSRMFHRFTTSYVLRYFRTKVATVADVYYWIDRE